MPGEFTPFFPAAASKSGGASGTSFSTRAQFAPMTASANSLVPPDASPGSKQNVAVPSAEPHTHGGVNIEIKREGERISQIRIQCPCGELIELDCEY